MDLPITRSVFKRYRKRIEGLDKENQEIFIREFFESGRSLVRLRAWMMFFVVFGVATLAVASLANNIYSAKIGISYSAILITLLLIENYVSNRYLRNETEALIDFLEWRDKKAKIKSK